MRNVICLFFSIAFLLLFSISTTIAQQQKKIENENVKTEKKIEKDDKWIAMDKLLHFTASAGITGLLYHSYHCQFNNSERNSIYFSLSVAGISGIGKEIIDLKFRKTKWSWKDIAADAAGIAAGYFLFIKLKK